MENQTPQQRAKFTAHRWWQSMFSPADELAKLKIHPAPTVFKAQLKRCSTIDAAMLSEGFRDLWLSLPEEINNSTQPQTSEIWIETWAAIAAVLVFVKEDVKTKLATAAGQKGDGDKSIVSESRFAQLQNAQTPDEFVMRLRRILQQLGGKVSVQDLIKDMLKWFAEHYGLRQERAKNRLAVNWAMDYYQAAK